MNEFLKELESLEELYTYHKNCMKDIKTQIEEVYKKLEELELFSEVTLEDVNPIVRRRILRIFALSSRKLRVELHVKPGSTYYKWLFEPGDIYIVKNDSFLGRFSLYTGKALIEDSSNIKYLFNLEDIVSIREISNEEEEEIAIEQEKKHLNEVLEKLEAKKQKYLEEYNIIEKRSKELKGKKNDK